MKYFKNFTRSYFFLIFYFSRILMPTERFEITKEFQPTFY